MVARASYPWLLVVLALASACKDPPTDGSILIFVAMTSARPEIAQLAIHTSRVDAIYVDAGVAGVQSLTGRHIDCNAPAFSVILTTPDIETIDVAGSVRAPTLFKSFFAPPGDIREIRLLVTE